MPDTKLNIATLVAKMPEVDRQKPNEEPKPGQQGKFTAPDPEEADKIFAEILGGGRAHLQELLRLLRAPGDPEFQDYKAGYVIHGVVVMAGRPGREDGRRLVATVLAEELVSDRPSKLAKAFLIQELQTCGAVEAVPALVKQLEDPDLCEPAVRALLSLRAGGFDSLRTVLGNGKAGNRLAVLQALGVAREAEAAPLLKEALSDPSPQLRQTAAWGLANLGDASAVGAILKWADISVDWERIQANKTCVLLAERLLATDHKLEAVRIYSHVRDTRVERSERHIRATAERALDLLKTSG